MKKLTKEEAQELGCKRYYKDKLCPHCYERAPRLVNAKGNNCVNCIRIKRKKHFEANKGEVLARQRAKNKYDPEEYKERKARAAAKVQARREWARSEAYKIICDGRSPFVEIKKLDALINDDFQLSCNIRDLTELKMVLEEALTPSAPSTLPRVLCCDHCHKVFDNRQWWRTHLCHKRRNILRWIKADVDAGMVSARIRVK